MKAVLHSFDYSLHFLREQVADVAEPDLVAQPNGIVNHPAWTMGHLVFVCQMLGGVLGVSPWLPDDWAKRFGMGTKPISDIYLYEKKEDLLAMLGDAQQKIVQAVERLDNANLDEPFPDKTYWHVFPTIRHFLTQVLVAHTAYHVGQVAVWRRAMGFPSIQRSFE